jgi:UDP-N-acetylglucosamine--N-acetylmuramyl-(pentapeptide) pyrophosphoryl-undecaprenol N-acetylglucosamine transferase
VQGGRNDPFEVPKDLPVPYVVVPYLSDMQLGYAAADLMLCRGGAITVAETTALGMPAIYVPYPFSNQEQRRNALPVVEAGGGLLVDNSELTPDWIERNIIPLARDRQRLAAMGHAAAGYGRRDGDEQLLRFVLEAVS